MSQTSDMPLISVVCSTYKRRQRVEAAIRSVQAQTYPHWELIVTDDEKPAGESWQWLQDYAQSDPRIKPTRNLNGQGQAANLNHGMSLAKGQWIKLLHDDDRLTDQCLAQLAHVVENVDDKVVLITTGNCDPDAIPDNMPDTPPADAILRYRGNEALFGMYLQHDVGGVVPSAMMLRANVFADGVHFQDEDQLPNAVDSWFKALLLTRGDLLHIDQPLMIKHEDDEQSLTNTLQQHELDREFERIREMMRPLLDASCNPPAVKVVQGQVRLIRAMHRLSRKHPLQALGLTLSVWHPASWCLAIKWFIRCLRPNCCQHVKPL